MKDYAPSRILRTRRLNVILIAILALASLAMVLPVSYAAQTQAPSPSPTSTGTRHADVRLELDVPTHAAGESAFQYTATLTNAGPESADGTRFTLEFEPGTTGITLECHDPTTTAPTDSSAEGDVTVPASCPSEVTLPSQNSNTAPANSDRPILTGRIDKLPVHGKIVFTLRGIFPNRTSASTVFTATLPPDTTDDNPRTNRVEQQTTLTLVRPSISVTKTADKDVIEPGDTVTYTVTYENIGAGDTNIRIYDDFSFRKELNDSNLSNLVYSYTTECDAHASSTPCDSSWQSSGARRSYRDSFWNKDVAIPQGKKLVIKAHLTIQSQSCIPTQSGDMHIRNIASATPPKRDPGYYDTSSVAVSAQTFVRVQNIPSCTKPAVVVTKTQDKYTTTLGESRTYTVTYENPSVSTVTIQPSDSPTFSSASNKTISVPYIYTRTCDENESTIPCNPSWNGKQNSVHYVAGHYLNSGLIPVGSPPMLITLPPQKKVVFKIDFTIRAHEIFCLTDSDTIIINNRASFLPAPGEFSFHADDVPTQEVKGEVTGVPRCPQMSVKITNTPLQKIVAIGEVFSYTVTYENTGTIDARITIEDLFEMHQRLANGWANASRFDVPFGHIYYCDQTASTAECNIKEEQHNHSVAAWYSNGDFPWSYNVTIPPGKKLVYKLRILIGEKACTSTSGDLLIRNIAQTRPSIPNVRFEGGYESIIRSAEVQVRCADVSTKTVLSDNTPQVGDRVMVETDVSNSVGVAENVPVVLQLATDDTSGSSLNVLEATEGVRGISCVVESGNIQCPTNFAYDATTNTITGTIPKMPAGSSLKISVNTVLTTATKYLKTYKLYAQAPNVFGDRHLGPEGTNRSSATFSWTEKVTITPPDTPTDINDPCGVDNATWVKPEDTDMVRWELLDGGRKLSVHTVNGYLFAEGATSYDYGFAPDSGTLCSFTGIEIPMTGGRAADTIYATAFLLALVAAAGAYLKGRHDKRIRIYTSTR